MSGDIAPPSEPLTVSGDGCRPSWYRYFVQRKRIEDGATGAVVVTFDDERSIYPNSKRLTVASGELTETDHTTTLELGLPDLLTADTVGDASHLVVLAFDAKGRMTAASQVALNSDNVTEGTTNLFFTNARARGAISGASGISYNSATGVITLNQSFTRGLFSGGSHINYNNGTGAIAFSGTGISGTFTTLSSVTVADGLITNWTP